MGFTLNSVLSLYNKVEQILNNFDVVSSGDIIEVLIKIQPTLKSAITQNYLQGKIQTILGINDADEKRKLCKNLRPYLDWYLQGK